MLIFTDPHGCFLTFKALYDKVTAMFPGEEVVIAGDLPDRGPRTREMIQFVIDNKIPCIKGNHDDFMSDPRQANCWQNNGGLRALDSYKVDGVLDEATLKAHQEFLSKLPYWIEREDLKHENGRHLLVTHAPIRHGHLENQLKHRGWDGQTFIWNRMKCPRSNVKPWFNVHGHNPLPNGPEIAEWYANIDTGCAYAREYSEQYGVLTCLRFPSMEVFQQKNIEDGEPQKAEGP